MPALPPTSIPAEVVAEIHAPSNIIPGDTAITGPFPKDVVWVWFRDEAPQAARQAAIDAVGGVVIGGHRVRPGGVYYVRLGRRGRALGVSEAIAILRSQPEVRLATPDLSLTVAPHR